MDRKEFIKKTAGAAAAVAVGNLLYASPMQSKKIRVFEYRGDALDGQDYQYTSLFTLDQDIYESMAQAELKIIKVMNDGTEAASALYRFDTYKVKQKTKDGQDYYVLYNNKYQRKEGPDLIPQTIFKSLAKKKSCIFLYEATDEKRTKIQLINHKGKQIAEVFEKVEEPSVVPTFGCFLVSLCTEHKKLPKDCYELRTMEEFTFEHVAKTREGKRLLYTYYKKAPEIVSNIQKSAHKSQILDEMYSGLVEATLERIEAGKAEEALCYYTDYTESLLL